jgi:hypothetical protein
LRTFERRKPTTEINLDGQISDINEKSGQQKNKSVIKKKSIKHPPWGSNPQPQG